MKEASHSEELVLNTVSTLNNLSFYNDAESVLLQRQVQITESKSTITIFVLKNNCLYSSINVYWVVSLRKWPTFCNGTTGFPHNMMSEEQAQKFHTNDLSLPWFRLVEAIFSTNQKHYQDQGSDMPSASDVIQEWNQLSGAPNEDIVQNHLTYHCWTYFSIQTVDIGIFLSPKSFSSVRIS